MWNGPGRAGSIEHRRATLRFFDDVGPRPRAALETEARMRVVLTCEHEVSDGPGFLFFHVGPHGRKSTAVGATGSP